MWCFSALLGLIFGLLPYFSAGNNFGSSMPDSVLLPEVFIKESRLAFLDRPFQEKMDTVFLSKAKTPSLSSFLTQHNTAYLRTNSPGLLSTMTIRGGAAVHTRVLWNGFPIHSPMNALVDFSLLPLYFIDQLDVVNGSSMSMPGESGLAGTVILNSKAPASGTRFSATSSYGSFSELNQQLQFSHNYDAGSFNLRAFYHQSTNNFSYSTPDNNENRRLSNAESYQSGVLGEKYLHLSDRQRLAFRFWFQEAKREIPPTIFQDKSLAFQQDLIYRPQIEWHVNFSPSLNFRFSSSASFEEVLYDDEVADLFSTNRSQSYFQDLELVWKPNTQHHFLFALRNQYQTARADGYSERAEQMDFSFLTAYKGYYLNRRGGYALSLKGLADETDFYPSGAVEKWFLILKNVRLTAKTHYDFRKPSFNDLYWVPGGNPELLPEIAFGQEIDLETIMFRENSSFDLIFNTAIFHRKTTNYIQWRPGNNNFWEAFNLSDVTAMGADLSLSAQYSMAEHSFKLSPSISYVRSYLTESPAKEQLIYTPEFMGSINFYWLFKRISLIAEWQYTGERYLTTDNSQSLQAYNVLNMAFQYQLLENKHNVLLFFRANNLFNATYQNMSSRPMPGINFKGGIQYTFIK